jgi:uncharacterized membrane protein
MSDSNYITTGKWLFAIAFLGIGTLHVVIGRFTDELFPVVSLPAGSFAAYLIGGLLMAAGILMLTKKYALAGAFIGAGIFGLCAFFLHIPQLLTNLHATGDWTPTSENFMFFSGSLMLAGTILINQKHSNKGQWLFIVGKYLFALTLLDFSIEHCVSEKEVLTFMPSWIPWKDFWAYFVMCAFFAASISLFINKQAKLAMQLLFLMFFLWVILLHLPQVISNPGNAVLWSFFFVPVGVCGIALIAAGSLWVPSKKKEG